MKTPREMVHGVLGGLVESSRCVGDCHSYACDRVEELLTSRDAEWSDANDVLTAKCGALTSTGDHLLSEVASLTKRLEEAAALLKIYEPYDSRWGPGKIAAFFASPPPADSPVAATITLSAGPDAGAHPWPQEKPDPPAIIRKRRPNIAELEALLADKTVQRIEMQPDGEAWVTTHDESHKKMLDRLYPPEGHPILDVATKRVPGPGKLAAIEARVTALEKAVRLRWGAYDTAAPGAESACADCGGTYFDRYGVHVHDAPPAPVAEPVCVDCGQPDATNGQHDWHHPFKPKQPEVAEKPDGAEPPRPTCDHGVSIATQCVKCKQPEVAAAHAYALGTVPGHCYARVAHGGYCNEPVYDPIHATAKGKGG